MHSNISLLSILRFPLTKLSTVFFYMLLPCSSIGCGQLMEVTDGMENWGSVFVCHFG
jgi:hypothetical protein